MFFPRKNQDYCSFSPSQNDFMFVVAVIKILIATNSCGAIASNRYVKDLLKKRLTHTGQIKLKSALGKMLMHRILIKCR
jgi:hypothetical protein